MVLHIRMPKESYPIFVEKRKDLEMGRNEEDNLSPRLVLSLIVIARICGTWQSMLRCNFLIVEGTRRSRVVVRG